MLGSSPHPTIVYWDHYASRTLYTRLTTTGLYSVHHHQTVLYCTVYILYISSTVRPYSLLDLYSSQPLGSIMFTKARFNPAAQSHWDQDSSLPIHSSQPPDSMQLTTTGLYTAHKHRTFEHNHLTLYSSQTHESIQLTTT